MITAELAWQYDRVLMALPGRAKDEKSAGCNFLIKSNKAEMIENAEDLLKSMGWNFDSRNLPKQKTLPLNLNEQELLLLNLFNQKNSYEIDEIINISGLNSGQTALTLLDLEIKGLIKTLPGKKFQILCYPNQLEILKFRILTLHLTKALLHKNHLKTEMNLSYYIF